MSGWICSYRKIWEHPIFKDNALRVGVWTWMLHTAAWKDTRFRVRSSVIDLKRGQLCISQRQVCESTGMTRQQLRTFLAELQHEGAIKVTQTTTKGRSIVSICKYEEYQDKPAQEKPASNPAPTQRQPTKEQYNNITTSKEDAALPPSKPVEVSVAATAVWNCKPFLESKGVKNPGQMIGKWLRDHKPTQIIDALDAAQRSGTEDPIPYITKALKGGNSQQKSERDKQIERWERMAR